MHPYFTFKDLVTIFFFFLVLSIIVFYYPNLMGQQWPIIVLLIVYTINACAISWKYILDIYLTLGTSTAGMQGLELIIYNRTIFISVLIFNVCLASPHSARRIFGLGIFRDFVSPIFIFKLNPYIVRYYYKMYNQQITKLINLLTLFTQYFFCWFNRGLNCLGLLNFKFYKWLPKTCANVSFEPFALTCFYFNPYIQSYKVTSLPYGSFGYTDYSKSNTLNNFSINLLGVGISETIRTQKNKIKNKINLKPNAIGKGFKNMSTLQPLPLKHFTNLNYINKNISVKDSHNNEISLKFKQWFAGITDGDGYIYVNKSGNVGFEMTLPSSDEKVLRIIQNKFGGNIHGRSGLKAVRYRTQKRDTIIKIIHCLNGLVINNIRLAQLHKACLALNIPIKEPITPTIDSAYTSGLLDSDGSINFYIHKYNDTFRFQLTISIGNKSRCNIEFLKSIFSPWGGGQIYFDKSNNGFYIWRANSKLLHLKLYDYFLKFPPKTIKVHRTYLIKEFHELNDSKVYRDTNILSMNYKIWKNFLNKWNNTN